MKYVTIEVGFMGEKRNTTILNQTIPVENVDGIKDITIPDKILQVVWCHTCVMISSFFSNLYKFHLKSKEIELLRNTTLIQIKRTRYIG